MDLIKKTINKFKYFIPKNSKVALKSSVVSSILAFISSLICYFLFRNGVQPYHDIIFGDITLSGLYKDVDFFAYYTFVGVYLMTFIIFNAYLNNKTEINSDVEVKLQPHHFIIGLLPAFLAVLIKINTISIFIFCFCTYLAIIIILLKKVNFSSENITKLTISCFYLYLSACGILAIVNYYLPNIADRINRYFIPIIWVALLCFGYIIYLLTKGLFKKRKDLFIDIVSLGTQYFIPLCLFGLINIRYLYKGAPYNIIYYGRFKKAVIAAVILFCVINLILLIKVIITKKRPNSVSLITLISFTAISLWNSGYNMVINPDQFHTGETAIVYQQIVQMGQKWGSEFVSVLQGLGFSISWLNNFLFGGTFSTYSQTQNILLIVCAALTVVLLYPIIKHKWLILLIAPVMPIFYINRIYLVIPVFLLLLNPKTIKNPFKWTYCYILTCIIHILYQPTYGGALAAAFLPVLFIIWYNALKNRTIIDTQKKATYFKFALFLLSVLVIGILCIPMLLNAVHFLRTNGYETLTANGYTISQSIKLPALNFTGYTLIDMAIQFCFKFGSGLLALIIMLYMFVRYVLRQKDEVLRIQGFILTLSAIISYFLMLPAIYTRIDQGLSRIGAVGCLFLGFLVLILLYQYRKEIKIKPVAIFIFGISLSVGFYMNQPTYLNIHQKECSVVNIPDDAIYAKPEETGLKNLGYSFVQNERYLHESMVINEVCNYLLKDNQTYYDFTNKSIYYFLTNRKVPGLYVASYVASNQVLQEESVERLKQNDVPIIFIKDETYEESISSYRIYRYIMEQNYNFVRYKGCNFLVRGDINLSPIKQGMELLDLSNTIGIYDNQIDESSYNEALLETLTGTNLVGTNSITASEGKMQIDGIDPNIVYKSSNQIDFCKIQLVEINLKNNPAVGMKGQLFVQTNSVMFNENNTIHFDIKSKRILIPLYKYQQFQLNNKLVSLRLDFDNVLDRTDVTVDSIKLYSLNDQQKDSLQQQFVKMAANAVDNRLDDIFHLSNLMYLPSDWGHSFNLIKNRLLASETAQAEQKNVTVNNTPVTVHFDMKQSIPGSKGELLRIKLNYNDKETREATIIVKGKDKKGNEITEEFLFATKSDNMLIPVGSSPNCLLANEITGFDMVLTPAAAPYEVNIVDAQMYQLIK